jgi:polysaccharide pyruvyl transferase CsaB
VGRRVAISGYYGFGNLGDEAVLAATVEELRRRVPEVEITVLSASPEQTSRTHGVRAVSRRQPAAVARALARCDLFLSGGGSLFQDATSWRSPWYYLGTLAAGRVLCRRAMVYAQGIEPPRRAHVRAAMAFLFNRVDLVTVRDSTSHALLTEWGIRRPRVVLGADPSLLLTPEWTAAARVERAEWGDGAWCGMALRAWDRTGDALRAVMAGARITAQTLGIRWALLPMQPSDLDVCDALARHLGPLARVVRASLGPREMLALIGSLELLAGMRLHGLLFAASQGVPVVPIAYDPKVDALMRDLGGPAPIPLRGIGADQVIDAVTEAMAERPARRTRLLTAMEPLRERAALAPALAAGLLR